MSSSIAVRQFVRLARGEMGVQAVGNPFRVVCVAGQERYCLQCCGKRWFDVIFKRGRLVEVEETAAVCRCCGEAVAHPDLVKVSWR